MATTNERREIRVEVVTNDSGLKALSNQFGALNKNLKNMSSSFGSLNTMFQGFLGANVLGFGLRQLADMADSMQLLTDRLNLFTDGRGAEEMERLFQIAEKTKAPIESVAETYNRFAMSTKDLGLSSKELGDIITVLQNTFRLSGAGVQEASSATIQLSQALSLGKLQGQEFRAVMLSNATFADLLGKSLGKTRGELAKMSEAGQLTSDVVLKALKDGMVEVNTKADALGQTFGQTLTLAMNDLASAVGSLNSSAGLSKSFAEGYSGIKDVIKNIKAFIAELKDLISPVIPDAAKEFGLLNKELSLFGEIIKFQIPTIGLYQGVIVGFSDRVRQLKIDLSESGEKLSSLFDGVAKSKIMDLPFMSLWKKTMESISSGFSSAADSVNEYRLGITELSKKYSGMGVINDFGNIGEAGASEIKKQQKYVFDYNKEIRELNGRFNEGKVSLSEYTLQFKSLEIRKQIEEMKEGKATVRDLNKALREIRLTSLNIQFSQGAITVAEFNRQVEAMKIDELNEKLETGVINLIDYNKQLVYIQTSFNFQRSLAAGASDYLQQVGTTGSQVAKAISGAFSSLEDGFTEFIKTGKQDWKGFAQGILDDINRIIIRAAIVQPLAEAALSFLPGAGAAATGGGASGGAMFSGSDKTSYITNQYSGPSSPSSAYAKTSFGSPSVNAPVYVNVTNNSSVDVSTEESKDSAGNRVIDVLIQNRVKDGIMSGAFDKQFSQAFNMKRKG